jgi:hypothetical protein
LPRKAAAAQAPGAVRETIERFLTSCREPIAVEPGQAPFLLTDDCFRLEEANGRLSFEAWDESRYVVRRLRSVEEERAGRLTLITEHFGGKRGTLALADQSRPRGESLVRSGARGILLESLGRFLARQFGGWQVIDLTTGANLEASLSPRFPRALLRKGNRTWAAIAAPAGESGANEVLTFGLIWLDYLRRTRRPLPIEGLALFLPAGTQTTTCLRLKHLDPASVHCRVFLYDDKGFEDEVDPKDHGNLDTRLAPALRHADVTAGPESQLGVIVQANLQTLDASLRPAPVYGQVPALAGGDRDLIDLLAVDQTGRLAVIELKASEDPHLPLQALDYWMRVRWHAERAEFEAAAYFPGIPLLRAVPRLLLVAPALQFHPSTETVLRFFAPAVPVERIGLGVEWQRRLHVAFRVAGASRPDWAQG